jgi:hypothetical protein
MSNEAGINQRNIVRPESVSGRVDVFGYETSQRFHLGTAYRSSMSRLWRYAMVGAVAITRALMQQAASLAAVPFQKYSSVTQTGYAHAKGATGVLTVLVTTGALATGLDNVLADGLLMVTTGTNIGDVYNIVWSHQVDETHVQVLLDAPLRNAIAATDKVSMSPSSFYGTIVAPVTTLTAPPAGVPLIDVPIGGFYWAQRKGPCPMIVDTGDTLVVGGMAGVAGTSAVAGTAGNTTATAYAFPTYGRVLQIGAADEVALIDLNLE